MIFVGKAGGEGDFEIIRGITDKIGASVDADYIPSKPHVDQAGNISAQSR